MKGTDILRSIYEEFAQEMGWYDHNMKRDRPYTEGEEPPDIFVKWNEKIEGVTFRDLRDCFIRAMVLSDYSVHIAVQKEALKGENAVLCEDDVYNLDMTAIDPMFVLANLVTEIEKLMRPEVVKARMDGIDDKGFYEDEE